MAGYWKSDKGENMSNGEVFVPKETLKDVEQYPFKDIPERGIRRETCERFGVRASVSTSDGKTVEALYFPSYNQKGKITGYKKQDLTKDKSEKYHWSVVGNVSIQNKLFGQEVAESIQRKRTTLTYTEGEHDTMACFQSMCDQVQGTKYEGMEPSVVSISLGTANAVEATLHNQDFVLSYDALNIFFDDDYCTPAEKQKGILKGHEAREAVANALVGASIGLFTTTTNGEFKDASDMLQAGRSDELAKLVQFGKRAFSAEKIVHASDIDFEELITEREEGLYINCFPKLMQKIHGFRKRELVLLTSPSGVGKCHGKGTTIRMADMSTKKVEEITVGEFVMGYDGTPRKVVSLHQGVDKLFKITDVKGNTEYTVNSEHLLSLKSNETVKKRGFVKDSVTNISVTDYLGLPKHYKEHVLTGYKADLTNLNTGAFKPELKNEAYILGLWFAEGTSAKPQFTICRKDTEIQETLDSFIIENGFTQNVSPSNNRSSSISTDIVGGYRTYLDSLGVLNNKHIPLKVLSADYSTRLDVLAGIIDGDGFLMHNCVELVMKDNQLAYDIVTLARSVGLSVSIRDKFSKCQNFEGEIYKRILISGNIYKIPNRLSRKKGSQRKQCKDALRSGLIVEELGIGDYYGFEVDGNHLYCLEDFSVTHNSTVTSIFAGGFMEAGEKVGMIYLEETNKETLQRMVAAKLKVNYNKFKNKPLGCGKSREEVKEAYDSIVNNDQLIMLGHFGSLPITELMSKVRHMHLVEGCSYILLDHLSVVISGSDIVNERKELDMVMTELAAFCAANDVCIIAVSHIKRLDGQDYKPPKGKENESFWIKVTKESMRGSAALEQLSFIIIGLEPEIRVDRQRGLVRLTCLKNRPWSYLGDCDEFSVDEDTWEVILNEVNTF